MRTQFYDPIIEGTPPLPETQSDEDLEPPAPPAPPAPPVVAESPQPDPESPRAQGGLVGVIANDSARYSLFSACIDKLDLPEGWRKEWLIGGDWCGARNDLVRMTLEGGYTHLWFMDDDHAFPPGILKSLLAHDVALINPMCVARLAPFPLVTYAAVPPERAHETQHGYLPVDLSGAPPAGLITLEAGGCAGMLIRRDVLEAIPDPWFEHTNRSEDVVFCEKAKAAGFQLYGDLSTRLGHITTAVVSPEVNDGKWMTLVNVGGGLNVFVSLASEWEEAEEESPPDAEREAAGRIAETIAQALREDAKPAVADPAPPGAIERVELWAQGDEKRVYWYVRAIDQAGEIVSVSPAQIQEQYALDHAMREWPDVPIFMIHDARDDSRRLNEFGPSPRLWDQKAV